MTAGHTTTIETAGERQSGRHNAVGTAPEEQDGATDPDEIGQEQRPESNHPAGAQIGTWFDGWFPQARLHLLIQRKAEAPARSLVASADRRSQRV